MRTGPNELEGACEEARAAMAAFFSSGFNLRADAERQARMRAHVEECAACAESYREMGARVASFKELAEQRAQTEARRAQGLGRRVGGRGLGALSVLFTAKRKPPSNKLLRMIWHLRPVLMVTFFVVVLSQLMDWSGGGRMTVERVRGEAVVDGRRMTDEARSRVLGTHGSFRTFDGELRIEGTAYKGRPAFDLLLSAESSLLLTERQPLRFVLTNGQVEVDGAFELIAGGLVFRTPGLLEAVASESGASVAATRARVVVDSEAATVELDLSHGALQLTTGNGQEVLAAPVHMRFNAHGQPVPLDGV